MSNKSSARKEVLWLFALVLTFGLALGGWIYFSKRWNPSPLVARDIGTAISQVGFTPNGKQFVAITKGLRFFSIATQLESASIAALPPFPFDFAFAPDGSRVATAHTDNSIHVWSLLDRTLLHTIKFHDEIPNLAFSPDGKLLASGSWSKNTTKGKGKICLWSASSGKLIHRFPDQPSFISDLAFSSDGKTLFSAGGEGTVKAWNIVTKQMIREYVAAKDSLLAVAVSPDGKRVAAGGWNKKIHLWNVSTGATEEDLDGAGAEVRDLDFASDSTRLAVASSLNEVSIWNVDSHAKTHRFTGHKELVFSVQFSPDNTLLISGDQTGNLRLWRVE